MLLKLFKYDFRSIVRYWWITIVLNIACIDLVAACGRYIAEVYAHIFANGEPEPEGYFAFLFIGLFVAFVGVYVGIFGMALSSLAGNLLVYVRFFKHLFTDEGYLTFTLPVSRRDILKSKLLCAVVFGLSHVVVSTVGVLFLLLVVPPSLDRGIINPIAYETIAKGLWELMGGWSILWGAISALQGAVSVLVSLISTVSIAFFCITLGAVIFRKGKVFASIGCYVVINEAVTILLSLVQSFGGGGLMTAGLSLIATSSGAESMWINMMLLVPLTTVINAAVAAVFYFGTRHLLERRLNLT